MSNSHTQYDAIIIGAGHNGLTTAAYLARAGRRVLVLERRHLVGGATVTEEIYPGFKYSVFSYLVSLLRPEVIHDLKLVQHGLALLPLESTLNPLPNGDYLYRDGDHHRTLRDIARHSPRDAEAYPQYKRTMLKLAQAMHPLLRLPPPDLDAGAPVNAETLAAWSSHFRDLPRDEMALLLEMFTLSAAELLERWFESEVVQAALATSSIIGSFVSPRSPGSAYVLLHHYMGEVDGVYRAWGFPKGGTGAVAEALAGAARAFGVEIRTEAPVAAVNVVQSGGGNGRVTGVTLVSGETIAAPVVASCAAPQVTFLQLVDPAWLPEDLTAQIRRWNSVGSSGKVNLALDGLPEFACMPGPGRHLAGGFGLAPSLDYVEAAYEDARNGRFSRHPFIDLIIPSVIDPDMAPPGKHVLSCFVQYAPYHLAGGWNEAQREAFGDAVVDVLATYIPNIRDLILHRQVLTPVDIERIAGITGGNIFHGELTLEQLFWRRPAAGYAQYRTPIYGYYQCGSGAHPGGGIMGAPGRLAAQQILRDW
jgi:phytoene dehydrogenase-like protein